MTEHNAGTHWKRKTPLGNVEVLNSGKAHMRFYSRRMDSPKVMAQMGHFDPDALRKHAGALLTAARNMEIRQSERGRGPGDRSDDEQFHAPEPSDGERSEYVYVVKDQDRDMVKIGKSVDPESRLSSLQTASPSELELVSYEPIPDSGAVERDLHDKYDEQCVSGEWFDLDGGQVDNIVTTLSVVSDLARSDGTGDAVGGDGAGGDN